MSVKILGGILKGLGLPLQNEKETRPTSVLLKRKIFDFRQDWSEFYFADLCAGTGSMGFEAWSRGALELFMLEINDKNVKGLQHNVKLIKEKYPDEWKERNIEVVKTSVEFFLNKIDQYNEKYHFKDRPWALFIDPPYQNHKIYHQLREFLIQKNYWQEVWIESDRLKGIKIEEWPKILGEYYLNKEYHQGDHYIIQYLKKTNTEI